MSQEPAKEEPKVEALTLEQATAKLAEAQADNEKIRDQNKELLHETMGRKEKLREYEAKIQQTEQRSLEEQEKYKELYEQSKPKIERLERQNSIFENLYEKELEAIDEDKRELVPELPSIEQKYEWLRTAKAKGIFSKPEEKPAEKPANSIQSKVGPEAGTPEFTSWGPNDPRLTKLSNEEYKVWRSHNRKSSSASGWGG